MKNNIKTKKVLRIIGFIFLPLGVIFTIIGFGSFFSRNFQTFFFSFIGLPCIFIGASTLMYGYMKEINTYVANENKDVAKDVTNYMIDGTRDSIKETFKAIKEDSVTCPKCNKENDKGSKFCNECGAPLVKICSYCNKENDANSKFCNECGRRL